MTLRTQRLALALLLVSSCGGAIDGRVRSAAVAHRSEWAPEEPFLECEPGDVQIEGMPAAEIWRGRRSRWGHAPRPEGAVFDPGTGSWVSSPPALRYFVARCVADGPTCYWPAVLLACRGEHCDAVADNGAEEGTIDCANY